MLIQIFNLMIVLVGVTSFVPFAEAVGCHTTGPTNDYPINTSDPVFVARVPNGELY